MRYPLHTFVRLTTILAIGLSLFRSVSATVITVGPSNAGCSYEDLQAAIDSAVDGSEIHVAVAYTNGPVHINSKSLSIFGDYVSCDPNAAPFPNLPSGLRPILDGSVDPNHQHPVVQITGSSTVSLRGLFIVNGHNVGHNGGGIEFVSAVLGRLQLENVTISGNSADKGGGIFYGGHAASDELILGPSTIVDSNQADEGGGIRLEGTAHMTAVSEHTRISNNTAHTDGSQGHGGGIQVIENAQADIGSPGDDTTAVIYQNHARYGGGISLQDSGNVRLFSATTTGRARIEHNSATEDGGGVYLGGSSFSNLGFCGWRAGINANVANRGAAAFTVSGFFSFEKKTIDVCSNHRPSVTTMGGILACPENTPCNTMDDNIDQSADAATFDISSDGIFNAENIEFHFNRAGRLIQLGDGFNGNVSLLDTCLIAHNTLLSELIRADAPVALNGCTVVDNTVGAQSAVISMSSDLSINQSILWQPGTSSLQLRGGTVTGLGLITSEAASLFGVSNMRQVADPGFVDERFENYNLRTNSPAIDVLHADATISSRDINSHRRAVELLNAGVCDGNACPVDLGAFERQQEPAATFPPDENFGELADNLDGPTPDLPKNWLSSMSGPTSGWQIVYSSIGESHLAAHADDPGGVSDSTLATPSFSVGTSARLTFDHGYQLETQYDAAVLDIKIAGGDFVDIIKAGGRFVSGGYDAPLLLGAGPNPIAAGRMVWTGDNGAPTSHRVIVDLPRSADGRVIQLRWRVATDANGTHPGYWLYDVHMSLSADAIFTNTFESMLQPLNSVR